MKTLTAHSLDTGWTCAYFELEPGLYEFMKDVPVSLLADWSFDKVKVENWAAHLQRDFVLEATDDCVNYFLLIDSAPAGAKIYINGEAVAVYQSPGLDDPAYELDITNYVALGKNEIGFRVAWDASGTFSGVRLQPVRCG